MKDNVPSSTLSDIKDHIDANGSLTLNETTLGAEQFRLWQQIFPHQDFVVSDCDSPSLTNQRLTFTGTFAQLFPWEQVRVEVCLFDAETARHAVVRISGP